MDWQGQKPAEYLMQTILLVLSVVAFSAGYVMGSFQTVIQIYSGEVVLAPSVTVPNLPWFSHPLQWLDPMEA
ncbi:hypothetical protein MANES_13G018500v8 [Manihot esculenta]|uniref:Signal peptidase complex subunit 1 n=1 Tax=Manihot esculenta TaxID=3983 RepID=A0A2C9UN26_MANES|nr:hypothetical protein MANES_13G018500v8 [Manihot esculenta]